MLLSLSRLPPSFLLLSAVALLSLPPPTAASPSLPLTRRQDSGSSSSSSSSADVLASSSSSSTSTKTPATSSVAAVAVATTTATSTAAEPTETVAATPKVQDYSGFDLPASKGGQMLTIVDGTYPAGLGEPLNIILSSDSSPEVLIDTPDNGGFRNYILGLDFSDSCLGLVATGGQKANLGDGQGITNQTDELRFNFGDIYFGTCTETFNGGNHFRYWTQKTSGAIFIAASIEMDLASGHDIVVNGYDMGRDEIVAFATGQEADAIDSFDVTEDSTYSGTSSYGNYTYTTDVRYVTGLLQNTSEGINHQITVPPPGRNAIDGLVAVFTVKITNSPAGSSTSSAFPSVSLPSSFTFGSSLSALVAISSLALLI
ncbi:hypothetical protein BDY24DRAFT_399883 [Mrakia frigida]|uniref:uncharacterized protein n=1 Tax=Mrakia frigida TaxID=29902 RepID=UPI003FCC1F08